MRLIGGIGALLTMALALGTFMEVLDTSIANVAVLTISGSLGVATSEGTWGISSYPVASAITVPLTGWRARRVGKVKVFMVSVLLFSVVSALCGFAHNFGSLNCVPVAARVSCLVRWCRCRRPSSCVAIRRKNRASRSDSGR